MKRIIKRSRYSEKIDEENYQAIVDSFKDSIATDLGTLAVEFNYGQIFQDQD